MNLVEQSLADAYPGLIRIKEKSGKPPVSVTIVKNHYPDFKILFPEEGAGLWVEVKGHIRDRMYLEMLKNLPDSVKKFYRVLLVETSKKERAKVGKTLDNLGIVWAESPHNKPPISIPNEWFVDAANYFKEAKECQTQGSPTSTTSS